MYIAYCDIINYNYTKRTIGISVFNVRGINFVLMSTNKSYVC